MSTHEFTDPEGAVHKIHVYDGVPDPAETTTYESLRTAINQVLDRDGQHDWDENNRLAELIASKVWNETHLFPIVVEPLAERALTELESWAQSHAALKGGWGNVDDIEGFIAWFRAAFAREAIGG